MIEELRNLNKDFYKISAELNEYEATLSQEQADYMKSVILSEYKKEYYRLLLKCKLTEDTEIFELEEKNAEKIPCRRQTRILRRIKRNPLGQLLYRRIAADANHDLDELSMEIGELEDRYELENAEREDAHRAESIGRLEELLARMKKSAEGQNGRSGK